MSTINAENLKGKNIEYYDAEHKYKIGVVKRVDNKTVTVILPDKSKHRIPKENVKGQITRTFKREIIWKKPKEKKTFYNCKFHSYDNKHKDYFVCEKTGKKCGHIDNANKCKKYEFDGE